MKQVILLIFLVSYSFNISAQDWEQLGEDINGVELGDNTGASISISDDGLTMAIGSPYTNTNGTKVGQVRVFNYNDDSWTLKGSPIIGMADEVGFGFSLSLSADGDRVVVCASYGKIRVYEWNMTSWQQLGNALDRTLYSIALGKDTVGISGNGEVVVVGDYHNESNGLNSGQVRLYSFNGTDWQQKGATILGDERALAGVTVTIDYDGNTFATNLEKAIQVYNWSGTDWDLKGIPHTELRAEKADLSADGNTLAITGHKLDGSAFSGMIQAFEWNGTSWNSKGNAIVLGDTHGFWGSLSKNGKVMAAGHYMGGEYKGIISVFMFNGNDWEQSGDAIYGAYGDWVGYAFSLNATGNILGVGFPTQINNHLRKVASKSKVFRNDAVLGVKAEIQLPISLFPNPTSSYFTLDLTKLYHDVTVDVYNALGQLISTEKHPLAKIIQQHIHAPAGLYFVKVSTADEGSKTLRVIKR